MTIVPGLEPFFPREPKADELAKMIGDLIEQANTNYLKYLAAAATLNRDQVWTRYHESLNLEKDIDTLTALYETVGQSMTWRMPKQ